MSEEKKFLLRKITGDQAIQSEQEIRDLFQKGQCKLGDFLYDFSQKKWLRVGDSPAMAADFPKPTMPVEKKVIYFLTPGSMPVTNGPYSVKEMPQRFQSRELCESTWVFVDGDKEWRQVKSVKLLADMLAAVKLPTDQPVEPGTAASGIELGSGVDSGFTPSIGTATGLNFARTQEIEIGGVSGNSIENNPVVEKEEETKAFSALGLSLDLEADRAAQNAKPATPPATPSATPTSVPPATPPLKPKAPVAPSAPPAAKPPVPPPSPAGVQPKVVREESSYDGITAEIPTDPIWMIKQANSEATSGPFRFLEVVQMLSEGKLTKNDKISRTGSNSFVKIMQQYEFNVKYSLETVIERGVEKQKIFIKRRHPRVPYITGVQLQSRLGLIAGSCVNISAGGILMEVPKAEFNLGEILEIKIMPGLIPKAITCKALIIGKIPKIPPGYALKFEDLKNEDKEAIEFYIQETLKREKNKHV